MARKNHKRNGWEARQRRQERAADRKAEFDSLNDFQKAERIRDTQEGYHLKKAAGH